MTTDSVTPIAGYATAEGTEQYEDRFAELDPDHFRLAHGLSMSSIGLGTYLGDYTDAVDQAYLEAVTVAIAAGCNVIDSAINYRFQRSERAIGKAIHALCAAGFHREEMVVCTKGGFIPFDSGYPKNPRGWIEENLIEPGIITPDDIYGGGHCMTPEYLRHQIAQSLKNLQLETIDVYYVHNPETQLAEMNEEDFYKRLEHAFAALEGEVAAGRICAYGTATWDGYLNQRESGELLSLERVVETARHAGGDGHHMRFIQLPVNLAMTAAVSLVNQEVNTMPMTILEAARSLNVAAVASVTLMQAQLARHLPPTVEQAIPGLATDASRAIQFTRSAPGITTALVGMSNVAHVRANLDLASVPPMNDEQFGILFGNR